MKKALIAVLVGATALSATAAAAQPYGYGGYERGYRDSDRDGRPDHREWNRDRDRDGRPDQYDRRDRRRDGYRDGYYRDGYRGGYSHYQPRGYWGSHPYYESYGGWRTGQRFSYYNNSRYVIHDYHRYGLPAPRPGYRYYRDDNGNVVMAAIAGGVIGLILGGILSDNDGHRGYYR